MSAQAVSLFGPVIDMPAIHLVREAGDTRSICGINHANPVMVNRARPNLSPTFTVCPKCALEAVA